MRAHAELAVAADPVLGTRIERLRSEPPLVLRPTVNTGLDPSDWAGAGAAHVSLAAAAAGPLGGDEVNLDVTVGDGASLVLRTVAATLALPGPHAEPSRSDLTFRIGRGATLVWLPEPTIAAGRCDHHAVTRIHLDEDARLITREQLVLGRHGEQPGNLRQRLRVTRGQRPLHDQELRIEADKPGWRGPAVTGGRTALGNLLVVDPSGDAPATTESADKDVAVQHLTDTATLVTALAEDALTLRRTLDQHMHPTTSADSEHPHSRVPRATAVPLAASPTGTRV